MKLPTISSNCTVNRGNAPAAANGQGRVEFLDSRIVVVGSNGSRHSPALLALPGSIWNGSHSSLSTVLTVVAFVFVFVVLSRFLYVPGLIGGNDDWADAVRYMPEYTPADRLFEPSLDGIELARHVWMVMLLWLVVCWCGGKRPGGTRCPLSSGSSKDACWKRGSVCRLAFVFFIGPPAEEASSTTPAIDSS